MEGEAGKELGEDKRGKAYEENKKHGNEYDPVNHQSEEDLNKSTLQGHSQHFEAMSEGVQLWPEFEELQVVREEMQKPESFHLLQMWGRYL